MRLEIDIPSILYQDAKENRNYISLTKLEIAWKAIADGKPLEQEPTTKNDLGVDAVSRQAVIDLMMQKWGENFSGDDAMQESIDAIRVMPPVTPQEPRVGHWIDTGSGQKCSECHEIQYGYDNHRFYCGSCGAKMFESQESEDKE